MIVRSGKACHFMIFFLLNRRCGCPSHCIFLVFVEVAGEGIGWDGRLHLLDFVLLTFVVYYPFLIFPEVVRLFRLFPWLEQARIARFTQHHIDQLSLVQSPLEYMASSFPSAKEPALRAHLGSMGVVGDMQLQPIYTLSGGQKSRVAFAFVTFSRPHVLLLDERM